MTQSKKANNNQNKYTIIFTQLLHKLPFFLSKAHVDNFTFPLFKGTNDECIGEWIKETFKNGFDIDIDNYKCMGFKGDKVVGGKEELVEWVLPSLELIYQKTLDKLIENDLVISTFKHVWEMKFIVIKIKQFVDQFIEFGNTDDMVLNIQEIWLLDIIADLVTCKFKHESILDMINQDTAETTNPRIIKTVFELNAIYHTQK